MNSIYGTLRQNQAAVFLAKWYPEIGNMEKSVDITVELIGTIDRRTSQPVQNLRYSTKGTAIKLGMSLPIEENQTIEAFGWYWLITEVQGDLTEISPQAAAMGNVFKNVVPYATLVATRRVPNNGGNNGY